MESLTNDAQGDGDQGRGLYLDMFHVSVILAGAVCKKSKNKQREDIFSHNLPFLQQTNHWPQGISLCTLR